MTCKACGGEIQGKSPWAWYCLRCATVIKPLRLKAVRTVANAIQHQGFPRPTAFQCSRCGQYQAQFYEHRDYWRPLDVQPVCGRCNHACGPATSILGNVEHITLEAA